MCVSCSDSNCLDCRASRDVCVECNKGFYLENDKCLPCDVSNCERCHAKESCDLCQLHFVLINNKCVRCPSNCENCKQNHHFCSICDHNFVLDLRKGSSTHGLCVRGSVDFCGYYENDPDNCIKCMDDSTPIDNQCPVYISTNTPATYTGEDTLDFTRTDNDFSFQIIYWIVFGIGACIVIVLIIFLLCSLYKDINIHFRCCCL